jgi:hypothetical protein
VAELVDAPDSKSGGGDSVPVRFRPSVPKIIKDLGFFLSPFFMSKILYGALMAHFLKNTRKACQHFMHKKPLSLVV